MILLRTDADVIQFAADRAPTKAVQRAVMEGRVSAVRRLTTPHGFSLDVTTNAGVIWIARIMPNEEQATWKIAWLKKPAM